MFLYRIVKGFFVQLSSSIFSDRKNIFFFLQTLPSKEPYSNFESAWWSLYMHSLSESLNSPLLFSSYWQKLQNHHLKPFHFLIIHQTKKRQNKMTWASNNFALKILTRARLQTVCTSEVSEFTVFLWNAPKEILKAGGKHWWAPTLDFLESDNRWIFLGVEY